MRPLALALEATLTPSPPPPLTPSPLHSSLTPTLTGTCYSPECSTHGDCLWPSQNRYKPSWYLPQCIFIHVHTLAHFFTLTPLTSLTSLTPHTLTPSHPHTLTPLTLGMRLCLHVTHAKKSVLPINLSAYLVVWLNYPPNMKMIFVLGGG